MMLNATDGAFLSRALAIALSAFCAACASPASLREDGAASVREIKGATPQSASSCVLGQLDERQYFTTHTRRDGPGDTVIIMSRSSDELLGMYEFKRSETGTAVSVFASKGLVFRDVFLSMVYASLKSCGADSE